MLWERGDVVSKSGVVNLVDEDAEEGSGIGVGVGLQLGVDLNDESTSDCRKQTSLIPELACVRRILRWGSQRLGSCRGLHCVSSESPRRTP